MGLPGMPTKDILPFFIIMLPLIYTQCEGSFVANANASSNSQILNGSYGTTCMGVIEMKRELLQLSTSNFNIKIVIDLNKSSQIGSKLAPSASPFFSHKISRVE